MFVYLFFEANITNKIYLLRICLLTIFVQLTLNTRIIKVTWFSSQNIRENISVSLILKKQMLRNYVFFIVVSYGITKRCKSLWHATIITRINWSLVWKIIVIWNNWYILLKWFILFKLILLLFFPICFLFKAFPIYNKLYHLEPSDIFQSFSWIKYFKTARESTLYNVKYHLTHFNY